MKLLTINEIRNKYYNKKLKKFKPIQIYCFQSFSNNLIESGIPLPKRIKFLKTPNVFIPNGNLIKITKNKKKDREIIIKEIIYNWFEKNKNGPYKLNDKNKSLNIFYYLSGIQDNKYIEYQICSGPLNVLSSDCLDSVNCWIKK